MRIVLIGQAAFGASTLEALLSRGEEVIAVYTPPDRQSGKPDALKAAAQSNTIAVYQPEDYKQEEVFQAYRQLKPDLVVLAFVTAIIPQRYFDASTYGAICYHPSLLPKHRGASAINWALIMGDAKTGITIFWPDAGIDTGPILLQKEVDIEPDDTVGSLYFDHLYPMGVDAIVESVNLIREGRAPRKPQNEEQATYEPPCDDRVARINWTRSKGEIYNLIRGCDPQPGAFTFWKEMQLRLYDVQIVSEPSTKQPGEVIEVVRPYIQIAVPGGRLQIGRVRIGLGGKMAAADLASQHGLKPGDLFLSLD